MAVWLKSKKLVWLESSGREGSAMLRYSLVVLLGFFWGFLGSVLGV